MKLNHEFISIIENTIGYGLQISRTDITSSELLNLNAGPKLLIPAPGENKVIVLFNALMISTFNTSAYTTNGSAANLYYGTVGSLSDSLGTLSGTFFTHSQDNIEMIGWGGSIFGGDMLPTALINQPLVLSIDTDMTNGDGTASIWLYYFIQDIS